MIPIYTTDGVPLANAGPVVQAWPVWTEADDIGAGLDMLAVLAARRGANAIIAVKIETYWMSIGTALNQTRHVLFGTAVILGGQPAAG